MILTETLPALFSAGSPWRVFISITILLLLGTLTAWWYWSSRKDASSGPLSEEELAAMEDGDVLIALENLLMFEEQFNDASDVQKSLDAPLDQADVSSQVAHTIALLRDEVTKRGLAL